MNAQWLTRSVVALSPRAAITVRKASARATVASDALDPVMPPLRRQVG